MKSQEQMYENISEESIPGNVNPETGEDESIENRVLRHISNSEKLFRNNEKLACHIESIIDNIESKLNELSQNQGGISDGRFDMQAGTEMLSDISISEALQPLMGNKKVSVELPDPLAKLILELSDQDQVLVFLLLQKRIFAIVEDFFRFPHESYTEFRKVFHEYLDSVTDSEPDFDNESANFLIKLDKLFYSIHENTLSAYVASLKSQRKETDHES